MITQQQRQFVALMIDRQPPGFQLEVRHWDDERAIDFRYTRLTDGVWTQESLSTMQIECVVHPEFVADILTEKVLRKFTMSDETA